MRGLGRRWLCWGGGGGRWGVLLLPPVWKKKAVVERDWSVGLPGVGSANVGDGERVGSVSGWASGDEVCCVVGQGGCGCGDGGSSGRGRGEGNESVADLLERFVHELRVHLGG